MCVYIYIYGQNRYMRVCVHIYKWGCLKKGVPHNIYIHIHTHIYLCVCFQNLKDWYNFDLGECLKHRTQFSCSIYCKDKGDLEETIYFSYIIDIKIQQGLVFFAGRTHGWESLRNHTPKTNAGVIQYIQKSYTMKGLVQCLLHAPIHVQVYAR